MTNAEYGYGQEFIAFAADAETQLAQILDDLGDVVASPSGNVSTEARDALQHAAEIVDADRLPLIEALAKLPRPMDRGDAIIYATRLLEAAFTIGVLAGTYPSAKALTRRLEDMSPIERRKRQLGIQQRIINALKKLYPDGDPLKQGLSREIVRRAVASALGEAEGVVTFPTLDRARAAVFLASDDV